MNNFKENLRKLRTENNLTQTEIGKKLNIKQRRYSTYENGESEPNFDLTIKIADFFNVTLDELIR